MKRALLKANFFVDTELFQRVSQFEKALSDFFAAHGTDLERMDVVGAGDSEIFYIVKRIESQAIVAQPKNSESLSKKLIDATKETNPKLKKDSKPFMSYKDKEKVKRSFSAGKEHHSKVKMIKLVNMSPQGT